MKKHFLLLVIIMVLAICSVITVYALDQESAALSVTTEDSVNSAQTPITVSPTYQETLSQSRNDSLAVSRSETSAIRNDSVLAVLKLYRGSFMADFAKCLSLDAMLAKTDVQESYVSVSSLSLSEYQKNADGSFTSLYSSLETSPLRATVNTIFSPDSMFHSTVATKSSEKIEIVKLYCLDGTASRDGFYLYFITTKGDYVYYHDYARGEISVNYPGVLMPLDQFCAFASRVTEKRAKLSYGDVTLEDDVGMDLTPYRVGGAIVSARPVQSQPSLLIGIYNMWAFYAIILIVLGTLCAICIVLWRCFRKPRAKQP
ncbi:MAG: hypothetical protein IJW46_05870 [Clostridia bacterium]|nr:hypothetical protein [Clostridia bacterium]